MTHCNIVVGTVELKGLREAFPILKVTVDSTLAERDPVAMRRTSRGTNFGTGPGIPIAEDWTCGDSLGWRKQSGMLPTPATGGSSAGGTAR